jgi:hypothetical protein
MPNPTANMPTVSGARWRATHQHSVDAVLGAGVRTVTSRGNQFVNHDAWTGRAFLAAMCRWAAANPGATPDSYAISLLVNEANGAVVYNPGIAIAQTPDDLPIGTRDALVGGAYHEAWHTKYSRRKPLTFNEVKPVMERWGLLTQGSWAMLAGKVLEWSNIIEDIRIERVGCREFPGALPRMEALQDLILRQESEGLASARAHGAKINTALNAVTCYFRDVGLGYKTLAQRTALAGYDAQGVMFVETVLRPQLDAAMNLGAEDDLACVWLAMEVVAAIANASQGDGEGEDGEQGQQGKPDKGDKSKSKSKSKSKQDKGEQDKGEQGEQDGGSEGGDDSEEQDGGSDAKGKGKGSKDEQDKQDGKGKGSNAPRTFKVGDRAKLKAGPYAGREVEVTYASPPDENGVQDLRFALVEPD